MPKGQPFSVEQKHKAVLRVQELLKTGACPSPWAAVVKVSQELNCSPETVRVWLSKPNTPPKRRGRPPKNTAAPVLAERVAERVAAVPKPAQSKHTDAALDRSTALSVARVMLANAMDILKQLEAAR